MGKIKNARWYLFLFEDENKEQLFKVYHFSTMGEMSYVVGLPQQTLSNYYHGLIKDREVLKYCKIYQFNN